MPDVTVKRLEDMETGFRGGFVKVRAELGVTSFGMQVLEFPPDATGHPEHDHAEDGQEEVFAVLAGSGTLVAGGEEHPLEPGVFARVGPAERRRILAGPQGLRVLALGGTPGRPYAIKPVSELRRDRA